MKFVYYPSDLPGGCADIDGFVSTTKDIVTLRVGDMKEVDDKLAEELGQTYKFLQILDENQYEKLFQQLAQN